MINVKDKTKLTNDFYKELYPTETSGLFLEYLVVSGVEEHIFSNNVSVVEFIKNSKNDTFEIYGIDKFTSKWV